MTETVATRYAGTRVPRVEDTRLLTGHGTFVDDVSRPGMLHACFVRSPFARARDQRHRHRRRRWRCPACTRCSRPPTSTRTSRSRGTPSRARTSPTPRARRWPRARCGSSATRSRSSSPRAATSPRTPSSWSTSTTSRCPPSSTSLSAVRLPSVVVHEAYPDNVAGGMGGAPPGRGDVFARPRTSSERTSTSRSTRRCRWRRAAWSSSGRRPREELTIWAATQTPHEVRAFCARLLGIPEHRVRVIMRDTGGGFGQKVVADARGDVHHAGRAQGAGAR